MLGDGYKNVTAFVTGQKEENVGGPQLNMTSVLDTYCFFLLYNSTAMNLNHSSTCEHGEVSAIHILKHVTEEFIHCGFISLKIKKANEFMAN